MKQQEDAQSGQSAAFDSRVQTPPRVRFRDSELVQNKFAVLGILFFVTGFLGLPLLWLCRGFRMPSAGSGRLPIRSTRRC